MNDTPVTNKLWVETDASANQRIEQAAYLKAQAKTGGLKFETYLPPDIAVWVLDMVEQGVFIDPGEAVFVFMQQARDIDQHDDLKRDILKKRVEQGISDIKKGRTFTAEEVKARMNNLRNSQTEPVVWEKISQS